MVKRHTISFRHAFNGLRHTIKTQPNLRVHLTIAALVFILALLLNITKTEWLILVFTVMWVIVSEMINTSIEAMVDLLTDEYHQQAKIAKDVSAGMVLVGAIGASVVGLVIFIPYII